MIRDIIWLIKELFTQIFALAFLLLFSGLFFYGLYYVDGTFESLLRQDLLIILFWFIVLPPLHIFPFILWYFGIANIFYAIEDFKEMREYNKNKEK